MRRIPAKFLLTALACASVLTGCDRIEARQALKSGNSFYLDERYREALVEYQRGLQLDPSARFAWRSVGLASMALFRPGVDTPENKKYGEQAIDAFKKYLEAYPGDQKVAEYLITTLINAEKYDDALVRLKSEAQLHPDRPELQAMIVSTTIKAGRLDEAYDYAKRLGSKADPTVFYSVGVACWDKSYHDPMLDVAARGKVVDTGLEAVKRAIDMRPDYFEAMAYYNLLFREKAKLETDPVKAQEWYAKAEEWTKKAIAVRDAQKAKLDAAQRSGA